MKRNSDKGHLRVSENKIAIVNTDCIESEDVYEYFGVTIDSKLSFENHINKICKKVSRELNALATISNYMVFDKRKVITKGFITLQLSYCPLVWMFQIKILCKEKNALHETALRVKYGDKNPPFNELLEKENSVSVQI